VYELSRTLWAGNQQGHGPLVLLIAVWLFWRKWPDFLAVACPSRATAIVGTSLVAFGCFSYFIGRTQDIWLFEVGASIPILAGCILTLFGGAGLRAGLFPLLFLAFLIPLPSQLVDALTQPMKLAVSISVEWALGLLGYPVSRAGVMLNLGPYQLLVADACAGLNTLFVLEAMGLLYLNIVKHTSAFRNIAMVIAIVPIGLFANVIRVLILCLITYHFGDAAGQGFLHGFAGMVLFMSALILTVMFDAAFRRVGRK
jgi:exosortase B